MKVLKSPYVCGLLFSSLFLSIGATANADFAFASAQTFPALHDNSSGISAAAVVANEYGRAFSDVGGNGVVTGLMQQEVSAVDDDNNQFTGHGSSAVGIWDDKIIWRGTSPAPDEVLLKVRFHGVISDPVIYGMHSATHGIANSKVEVTQNGFINRGGMGVSFQVDYLVTGTTNTTLGSSGPSWLQTTTGFEFSGLESFSLRKDIGSDTYNFQTTLTTDVTVNSVSLHANLLSTMGLTDVTLSDGTRILDQISLESGLPFASVNPIPEPASMALFGMGLAGCGVIARRRKNSVETTG